MVGGQAQPFGRWPAGVDPDLRVTTRKVTIPQQGGARVWSEAGHGYLVSVHGERLSRRELVAIALAIARSTRRGRPIEDELD
jgi:hypothetical protein